MKILNILTSKGLGGAEQAFIDYNIALSHKNYDVYAFYNKVGKIKYKIKDIPNVKYIPTLFISPLFLLLPYYFFKILSIKPDIIILHNRKAISTFNKIAHIFGIPVVIVAHVQKIKKLKKADYIFSITQYQKDIFKANDIEDNKIFVIPNMITFKKDFQELKSYSTPPVFGIIGRFDPMKGFPFFIRSCGYLKDQGIDFKVKIAGTPQQQYMEEYNQVKYLIKTYNLENNIEFIGWIDDKDEFYKNIDIFVLPSIYEPFGIVLLEAMMYSKPILSSTAEGPQEIFKNHKDSVVFFGVKDQDKLIEEMKNIINNIDFAKTISKNAYKLVNEYYTLEKVSDALDKAIKAIKQ